MATPTDLVIEPLHEAHFERLHDLFDAVCRERRFMAFTHAGPREQTRAYYRQILDGGQVHFVARRGEALLGWCDVVRQFAHTRQHAGVLGMAVAAHARGQGVGRRLIEAALAEAPARGISRVELTVHADNAVAQALYRSVGFQTEGLLKRGGCLDGQFHDVWLMARLTAA
jgi:putative acetyltransferase